MIIPWLPIIANVLLALLGAVFVFGGANTFSRFVGLCAVLVAVLSLAANTGVLN